MKVLELFAGTRSIGKAFEKNGHEVFSIDWDEQHPQMDWYTDITMVTAEDIRKRFGDVDVIWASPDCTTYSVAGISHHRRKEQDTLRPISDKAVQSDRVVQHVLALIAELKPNYWFIENPPRWIAENGIHARVGKTYRDLLSVRGYTDETNRYLDKS